MTAQLTLSEIAALVDGVILRGDSASVYTGLGALDEAGPQDVSFLGNPKYAPDFAVTKAGAVLVPTGTSDSPDSVALIEVENPTFSFGKIISQFKKGFVRPAAEISPQANIDPTAVVAESCSIAPGAVIEAGAVIGENSIIGPNCVIASGVKIGADCELRANCSVTYDCEIGDRVIIQPGAVIGSDGFGYEFVDGRLVKIDQVGIVVIEDDVEIGANTTIDRARFGRTVVGRGSKVDNLVQIGHNVRIGANSILVSQSGIAGSSTLGNYVTVAAQAGVAGHLKVGDQVTLAARAAVLKDLPDKGVYMGFPARPMREEQKSQARVARLAKLVERVKALEDQLADQK